MKINSAPNEFAHFAARSAEIEALRRLPRDVVDRLIDAGVFRIWIPQVYGGAEASLLDGLERIEEISYHDGSTGWCAMIGASTALLAGFLSEPFAQEIYGDPRVVTGGVAAPMGRAACVDGGLRVSGRWAWGSGTEHCQWIGGGCLVLRDGMPTKPPITFVFFRAEQIQFLDTWYASGLRGTGSTDFTVSEAFVPEGRWVELGITPPRVSGALYRFPFWCALALGVTSVSLGIARRAVAEFKILANAKRPMGSRNTLAESSIVQMQVAEAEAAIMSAKALLQQTVNDAWHAAQSDALTVEHRRLLRLAATNATLQAAKAVDLMYHAAGGSVVYTEGVLQRLFRDVHVATQHMMVSPRIYELVGRLSLGLETDHSQL